MIEKILNIFFTKTIPHKNRRVTVLRDRTLTYNNITKKGIDINIKKTEQETCLSKYFKDIKGLNVKERMEAEFNRYNLR